jgi:hypothetical protein
LAAYFSTQVVNYALSRLEAKGKGVLLLHDIQARTQAALPVILQQLKARGYKIVHVVPATPDRPKTPTEPAQWVPHWIHGPNIAAKTPSGFAFGAPETPPHNAARSVRSVWLMRQKSAQRTPVTVLHAQAHLSLRGKPLRTHASAADKRQSLVRLPAHPAHKTDAPLPAVVKPIKTGSRTDVTAGPNIR